MMIDQKYLAAQCQLYLINIQGNRNGSYFDYTEYSQNEWFCKKQKVSYVVLLPMVYARNDSQGYILLEHRVTVSSDRIEGEKN